MSRQEKATDLFKRTCEHCEEFSTKHKCEIEDTCPVYELYKMAIEKKHIIKPDEWQTPPSPKTRNDMKREEQIKEAARQRADQYDHPSQWSDTYYGFIDGAHWADSHPQWIPVEERLPGEGQVVLGVREGGTDVEMYKFMGFNESTDTFDWEWHPYYRAVVDDVTHWMPLPQAPRREEKK